MHDGDPAPPKARWTRAAAPLLMLGLAGPAVGADRELGRHLSSECVACHQLSGRTAAGVPAIIGVDAASFTAMMHAYRRKERANPVMQAIAAKFSDEEIAALAAFFAGVGGK